MDVILQADLTKFMTYLPRIRQNINEWKIVDIGLFNNDGTQALIDDIIIGRLQKRFDATEGVLITCGKYDMLALLRLGERGDPGQVKEDIVKIFPEYICRIVAEMLTKDGIKKIKLRLNIGEETKVIGPSSPHFKTRFRRKYNVIMVAAADAAVRALVNRGLGGYGRIIELADGRSVVEEYMRIMPDILFLDVDLPVRNGAAILEDIREQDDSACVIMIGISPASDDIIASQKLGASGFIARPATLEKFEEALRKCGTLKKHAS